MFHVYFPNRLSGETKLPRWATALPTGFGFTLHEHDTCWTGQSLRADALLFSNHQTILRNPAEELGLYCAEVSIPRFDQLAVVTWPMKSVAASASSTMGSMSFAVSPAGPPHSSCSAIAWNTSRTADKPRRRSFSNRFSACRYSMTISCCRWTHVCHRKRPQSAPARRPQCCLPGVNAPFGARRFLLLLAYCDVSRSAGGMSAILDLARCPYHRGDGFPSDIQYGLEAVARFPELPPLHRSTRSGTLPAGLGCALGSDHPILHI